MAIKLRGITWNHSRGKLPVIATAQRYMELHPEVEIVWDTRSLQAFGDEPIERLAEIYDMVVLDHPWMGFASANNLLVPLDLHFDQAYLADQRTNSVGKSFESYFYHGHVYATAIDAACPVAFYNPRKLNVFDDGLPETWEDVKALARRGGVVCAGNDVSILMQFYMHCATRSENMFGEETIAPRLIMEESLEEIKELYALLPDDVFQRNPIGIYEYLSSDNSPAAYCPFDFGYSNYSRRGYSEERIVATNVVTWQGKMLKTVLGGAGLAISAKAHHLGTVLDYVSYTSSGEVQKTLYVQNGGQPGHRAAWTDEEANYITAGFFKNTVKTLDNAYLRPRYNGYLSFQDNAGPMIRRWILDGTDKCRLLDELTMLYQASKKGKVENQ